jgi:hypothetical protein
MFPPIEYFRQGVNKASAEKFIPQWVPEKHRHLVN